MSLNEKDPVTRHRLARNMRSKMRSEEYQLKRRKNQFYFWLTLSLVLGFPMLYLGGIEYGLWVKPSRSIELYLDLIWLVMIYSCFRNFEQLRDFQKRDDQLMKLEMELLIESDTDTPNVA